MATVIIKTKDTRTSYKDANGMLVTLYERGENGWELEENTYDIFSIVGDTLSITQDEESTDETPHEFSDENLEENTTLGNTNFAADCTDYQDIVLKKIYGYTESNGVLIAPSEYKDRYALIQILFNHDLGQKDIVLPFVKLNARPTLEGMRTGTATGSITGIAKSRDLVTFSGSQVPSTYQASAIQSGPMCFVTEGKGVMVASGAGMTYVNPEDGSQSNATQAS